MTLLTKAVNTNARLKAGFLGFGGSGKTTTAAILAAGLAKLPGAQGRIAMFDTENGSDFLIADLETAGIDFLRVKSRSFKDLLTFCREAIEAETDAVIIDSVTHVWRDLVASYQRKLRRTRMTFRDWGPVKDEWAGFAEWYVDAPVHAIVCGRAGYEFDETEDEDGNRDLVKSGVKMKAEGEMGFEASILCEMVRAPKVKGGITSDPSTHGWVHRLIVLKDRARKMDGAVVDDPTFEAFRPHLDTLNLTGQHQGTAPTQDTADLFETSDSRSERKKQVEITLELIQAEFQINELGGQSKESKKRTLEIMQMCFGTMSWRALESMKLEALQDGLAGMRKVLDAGRRAAAPAAPGAQAKGEPVPAAVEPQSAPVTAAPTSRAAGEAEPAFKPAGETEAPEEPVDPAVGLEIVRARAWSLLSDDTTPERIRETYTPTYQQLVKRGSEIDEYQALIRLIEASCEQVRRKAERRPRLVVAE